MNWIDHKLYKLRKCGECTDRAGYKNMLSGLKWHRTYVDTPVDTPLQSEALSAIACFMYKKTEPHVKSKQ